MSYIHFEIVTPEKVVLKETVQQVTVPTIEGELTILPGHIPIVSVIRHGVIEVKKLDGNMEVISVYGGFLEVNKEKIVILADVADIASELDASKIEDAILKADEIKKQSKDIDVEQYIKMSTTLDIEQARMMALHKWKKLK